MSLLARLASARAPGRRPAPPHRSNFQNAVSSPAVPDRAAARLSPPRSGWHLATQPHP
jgi:hypothetical protein